MKKDIEWLKERVLSKKKSAELNVMAHKEGLSEDFESRVIAYDSVLKDINQFDKPETLSQQWIDKNKKYAGVYDIEYYIPVDKLYGKIVPEPEEIDRAYKDGYEKGKQYTFYKGYLEGLAEGERKTNEYFESITEEPSYEQVQKYLSEHGIEVVSQELPVIPKFVADYIDDRKEVGFPIYQAIRIVREDSRFEHSHLREWLWTNKGQETFARAWLDGYEVAEEREQKYYVDLESAAYVAKWDGNGQVDIYTDGISGSDEYELHLTEQEIKDYDERYWPFAVKVEELEEWL